MSTVAGKLSIRSSAAWTQEQVNAGGTFTKTTQKDTIAFNMAVDAAVFTEMLLGKYTLAAAGTQTVNFNSFTNFFSTTATCTKLKAVQIKATATVTGGQLKIEPGTTNDLQWPLSGTTPAITLDVGTDGCCILLVNGTTVTVSGTDANWKLSNPGSQQIVVVLTAFVGA